MFITGLLKNKTEFVKRCVSTKKGLTETKVPMYNVNGVARKVSLLHVRKEKLSLQPGLEVIKLIFMLNSSEHEIFPVHKC